MYIYISKYAIAGDYLRATFITKMPRVLHTKSLSGREQYTGKKRRRRMSQKSCSLIFFVMKARFSPLRFCDIKPSHYLPPK